MFSQPLQPESNLDLTSNQNQKQEAANQINLWRAFLVAFIIILIVSGSYFGWIWSERQKQQSNIQATISKCQQNLSFYKQEFGQVEISCDMAPPDLNQSWNWFDLQTKTSAFSQNIEALNSTTKQKYDDRLKELNQGKNEYLQTRLSIENLGYKKLLDLAKIQAQEVPAQTVDKLVLDKKMYENELLNLQPINKRFGVLLKYKLDKFWTQYKVAKKLEIEIPSQVSDLIQTYALDDKSDTSSIQNLPKFTTPEQALNTSKLSSELTLNTLSLTRSIYSKIQNSKDLEKVARSETTSKNYVNLPILMYHRIEEMDKVPKDEQSDGRKAISITPEVFKSQLNLLKEKGFETVNLDDIVEAIETQDKDFFNGKKIVISFDDGYPEHYNIAYPELKSRGFKGIFGIISEQIIEKQTGASSTITWGKLREMQSDGMQIFSHSSSHCAMGSFKVQDGRSYQDGGEYSKCDLTNQQEVNYGKTGYDMMQIKQAEYELIQSRKLIFEKIGVDQPYFMFPYGAHNEEIFDTMFQNGFKLGLGVGGGPNIDLNQPLLLNRITVMGNTKPGELAGWFSKI